MATTKARDLARAIVSGSELVRLMLPALRLHGPPACERGILYFVTADTQRSVSIQPTTAATFAYWNDVIGLP